MTIKFEIVNLIVPKDCNIILGQSHFIKTVEDLYEAMMNSTPNVKFGIAFCESSGPRLIRHDGNNEELKKIAIENALRLSAGHCFIIVMKDAYPINVLDRVKAVPEVVNIYCATGNPVQVIIGETEQGRAILGIIDGGKSLGVESEKEIEERKQFLRKIGYKR
ncbi:MAG: adenosine-specific kinase [Candidatus Methanomethylicia archaeon]|nr:adenosine-specific kinase [Candidatus Methanomethylicia archaeon]MDW7988543.1 adenosine-specific kinase [Nitrososphaerota archaeon]